ncbi:hypothetical protein J6590_085938 [Homalodisca vitripennis]|nr:hypothetical protein J6590_085938 [Homalodisca vitripennis]
MSRKVTIIRNLWRVLVLVAIVQISGNILNVLWMVDNFGWWSRKERFHFAIVMWTIERFTIDTLLVDTTVCGGGMAKDEIIAGGFTNRKWWSRYL